jgi:large repetitive protein
MIVGGFDQDKLTGGQGRDKFVYESIKDFGDVITDFEIVKDRFDLRTLFKGSGSMSNVRLRQKGDDTLVQVNAGSGLKPLATLQDVNADTLTARHFIF